MDEEEWLENQKKQKEYEEWLKSQQQRQKDEDKLLEKWLKNFKDKPKGAKKDYLDWKYGGERGSG